MEINVGDRVLMLSGFNFQIHRLGTVLEICSEYQYRATYDNSTATEYLGDTYLVQVDNFEIPIHFRKDELVKATEITEVLYG